MKRTIAISALLLGPVLRKVTVLFVAAEACSAAYPGSMTDQMLCAGLDRAARIPVRENSKVTAALAWIESVTK